MIVIDKKRLEPEDMWDVPAESGRPAAQEPRTLAVRVLGADRHAAVQGWFHRYSLTLLRVCMGAVILGFGVLKYFPGVSPAQSLVLATANMLTFGLLPAHLVMVLLATTESLIGLSLIAGAGLRFTIYPLVLWSIGTLSPIVLMPGRLFAGPDHAPTLEGQYVLKDVILLSASLLIAVTEASRRRK